MSIQGYFKIPRSLFSDPLWKSLPLTYKHVYLTILANVVFQETTQDDFGMLIYLKPGQMLTTQRKLAEVCDESGVDSSLVQRALDKFEKIGFSMQTSMHRKTIITITRKDIIELIDANFDANSMQTRCKLDAQNNNAKNAKNEKTTATKEDVAVVFYESLKQFNLTHDECMSLMCYSEHRVNLAVEFAIHPSTEIKTSLIQILVWHCKQKNPPQIKTEILTQQQILAWKHVSEMKENGFPAYEKQNKALIPEHRMMFWSQGVQTISLKISIDQVKYDLQQSKLELFKSENVK